ncbi:hypothetical protein CLOM_g12540 [Closterium sp. NIES-68]|nr:hypothetical protein CLOM_g12540 [Closterium sp. NIES-68]
MARLPSLVLPWVPSPNERGASADLPTPEIRGDVLRARVAEAQQTAASARVGWAVLHAVVVAALLLLNTALTQALVQHRWWFPACYGALFLATLLQYLFTSGSSPGYVQDVAGSIEAAVAAARARHASAQDGSCDHTLPVPALLPPPGAPGQAAAPGAAAAAVNSLAAAAPAALVLPAPPAAAAAAAAAAARQAGQVALEEETEGGAGEEEERCGEGEGDGAMDGAGEQGDESGLLRAVTSHSNGDGASIAALPPPHSSHSSLTVSRWGTPSRASLPHAAPLVPPPPPTSPATAPAAAPASAPPPLRASPRLQQPRCRWCGHVGCTWCGERGCRWCGDRRCCGWCGAGVDMACDDVERGGGDGERECSSVRGAGVRTARCSSRCAGSTATTVGAACCASTTTASGSPPASACATTPASGCTWCWSAASHGWSLLICLSAFTAPISPNHWLEHQLSALAFTVLLLPLAVFLAILVAFHTHLILTAQTTYEATRKHRISYLRAIPGDVHPFSHGACRNVLHLCCLSRHVLPLYAVPTPATLHAMVSQTYTTTSHACGPCCS